MHSLGKTKLSTNQNRFASLKKLWEKREIKKGIFKKYTMERILQQIGKTNVNEINVQLSLEYWMYLTKDFKVTCTK